MKTKVITSIMFLCIILSCNKDILNNESQITGETKSNIEYEFDWENIDYMPTPPGQSRIPVPWIGAGSITPEYGLEIAYDYKKDDGWILLYNTFDPNSPGELINPYFALYNKFSGILRIYLYINTPFISTSTYIQDGISIVTNHNCNLLNFLGQDIIDVNAKNIESFNQIQSKSYEAMPLASYKWYLLQYELAYDPKISSIKKTDIQLAWYLNYINVSDIELNGESTGNITGNIGAAESTWSKGESIAKNIGEGVLSGIGESFWENNRIDENGNNKFGIDNKVFNSIASGLKGALSNSAQGLPGAIIGFISGVFSSNGNNGITPVSLQLKTEMDINGKITEKGAFPSSPTTFYVPGTLNDDTGNGNGNVVFPVNPGKIELDSAKFVDSVFINIPKMKHDAPLGVVYFKNGATIETGVNIQKYYEKDPYDNREYYYETHYLLLPEHIDYSDFLIINPVVEKEANIKIIQQDLVHFRANFKSLANINPKFIYMGEKGHKDYGTNYPEQGFDHIFGVRFTIQITPKNGGKEIILMKTFKLKEIRTETDETIWG